MLRSLLEDGRQGSRGLANGVRLRRAVLRYLHIGCPLWPDTAKAIRKCTQRRSSLRTGQGPSSRRPQLLAVCVPIFPLHGQPRYTKSSRTVTGLWRSALSELRWRTFDVEAAFLRLAETKSGQTSHSTLPRGPSRFGADSRGGSTHRTGLPAPPFVHMSPIPPVRGRIRPPGAHTLVMQGPEHGRLFVGS